MPSLRSGRDRATSWIPRGRPHRGPSRQFNRPSLFQGMKGTQPAAVPSAGVARGAPSTAPYPGHAWTQSADLASPPAPLASHACSRESTGSCQPAPEFSSCPLPRPSPHFTGPASGTSQDPESTREGGLHPPGHPVEPGLGPMSPMAVRNVPFSSVGCSSSFIGQPGSGWKALMSPFLTSAAGGHRAVAGRLLVQGSLCASSSPRPPSSAEDGSHAPPRPGRDPARHEAFIHHGENFLDRHDMGSVPASTSRIRGGPSGAHTRRKHACMSLPGGCRRGLGSP
jgi:hypothetical protein